MEELRLFDVSELQRKNRELLVVKSNKIIQDVKYARELSLSLEQYKIIIHALGRIKQDYSKYKEQGYIALTYREFCQAAGINITNDRAIYRKLRASLRSLLQKGTFVKIQGKGEPWIRWLDDADLSPADLPAGYFKLTFGRNLLPYLIDVKDGNFTQFEEGWVMRFRTKYAPRLYEEFRSRLHRKNQGTWTIEYTLERLREIFFMGENESYTKNATVFREKILERSINEINEFSDLAVGYEYRSKSGKRISSVIFELRNKTEEEYYETMNRNNMELDKAAGVLEIGS